MGGMSGAIPPQRTEVLYNSWAPGWTSRGGVSKFLCRLVSHLPLARCAASPSQLAVGAQFH